MISGEEILVLDSSIQLVRLTFEQREGDFYVELNKNPRDVLLVLTRDELSSLSPNKAPNHAKPILA